MDSRLTRSSRIQQQSSSNISSTLSEPESSLSSQSIASTTDVQGSRRYPTRSNRRGATLTSPGPHDTSRQTTSSGRVLKRSRNKSEEPPTASFQSTSFCQPKRRRTSSITSPEPSSSAPIPSQTSVGLAGKTRKRLRPSDSIQGESSTEGAPAIGHSLRILRSSTRSNSLTESAPVNQNQPESSMDTSKGVRRKSEKRNRQGSDNDGGMSPVDQMSSTEELSVEDKASSSRKDRSSSSRGLGSTVANNESPYSGSTSLHGLLKRIGHGFDVMLGNATSGLSSSASSSPSDSADPSSTLSATRAALADSSRTLRHPGSSSRTIISGEFKQILEGLSDFSDEMKQIGALQELCERLSVSTEETLGSFSVEPFIAPLTLLLGMESNPEISLLACRAFSNLLEALPSCSNTLAEGGVIPELCKNLLRVDYIDLAEQAIITLEKLSADHGQEILRHEGLGSMLAYLDFFPNGVQRVAVSATANLMRNVPDEHFTSVLNVVPNLISFLQHHDKKVVEKACLAVSRLFDSFARKSSFLESLSDAGIVKVLISMLSGASSDSLSSTSYGMITKAIGTICKGSPVIALTVMQMNIAKILHEALVNSWASSSASKEKDLTSGVSLGVSGASGSYTAGMTKSSRNTDHVYDLLVLLCDVLPDVRKPILSDNDDIRVLEFAKDPRLLSDFVQYLLPTVIDVYTSHVSLKVKGHCMLGITKMLILSTSEILKETLKNIPFSGFIASLLATQEPDLVQPALSFAEIVLIKLPDIFQIYFYREGVVFELRRLSSSNDHGEEASSPSSSDASSTSSSITHSGSETHISNAIRKNKEAENERKEKLQKRAKEILEKYFVNSQKPEEERIRQLCEYGESLVNSQGGNSNVLMNKIALLFSDGAETISCFEVVNSQLVQNMLRFFASSQDTEHQQQRFKCFLSHFLSASSGEEFVPSRQMTPLVTIVRRLQESLSRYENFAVSTSYGGVVSDLRILAQPFKLSFRRDDDCTDLKAYPQNIVMIEPMATVQAIEDFLWGRVTLDALESSNGEGASKSMTPSSPSTSSRSSKTRDRRRKSTTEVDPDDTASSGKGKLAEEEASSKNSRVSQCKLEFTLSDQVIPHNMTIYHAINKFGRKEQGSSGDLSVRHVWSPVYTIKYRKSSQDTNTVEKHKQIKDGKAIRKELGPLTMSPRISTKETIKFQFKVEDIGKDTVVDVLNFLHIIWDLSRNWAQVLGYVPKSELAAISASEFVNAQLTAKLTKQLQDPLTLCGNSLPEWASFLVGKYQFLFPFATRQQYLINTAFGVARALVRLQEGRSESQNQQDVNFRVGRIQRQKVRISRARLFESALKVLDLYGGSKAILEIEYFDEVGTGLGPTMEFYTLVSKEFQKRNLQLWRDLAVTTCSDGTRSEYVNSPLGLFPSPMNPSDRNQNSNIKRLQMFRMLGIFLGKALLDSRTADVPLSPTFLKWLLEDDLEFSIEDVKFVDADLYNSLVKLTKLVEKKWIIYNNQLLTTVERDEALEGILLNGVKIEDLMLDFTLPGYPEIPLKPDGSNIQVTLLNLDEYIELVVKTLLVDTIQAQAEAFRNGFDSVVSLKDISMFSVAELDMLLFGVEENWDAEMLRSCIKTDHGYSMESRAFCFLIETLADFDHGQRRQFLQFATGTPRLPIGGFRMLQPPFTVVRKTCSGNEKPDDFLPSVMTCANYLKLPDYSTMEIMKERIMTAMSEGQGSFNLS